MFVLILLWFGFYFGKGGDEVVGGRVLLNRYDNHIFLINDELRIVCRIRRPPNCEASPVKPDHDCLFAFPHLRLRPDIQRETILAKYVACFEQ